MRLLANEYRQPFTVLEGFFAHAGLPEWKRALHHWTEAGLSRYSVLESTDPVEIFPFAWQMERLIAAGFLLWENSRM